MAATKNNFSRGINRGNTVHSFKRVDYRLCFNVTILRRKNNFATLKDDKPLRAIGTSSELKLEPKIIGKNY